MNFFRIRIITLLRFLGNSGQMHPYQADLSAIGFVLRNYLQNTARVRLGKNMRGFLQIERHDMRSASGDLTQPLFARFSCRVNRRCYQESQADKHDQALFICRFGFKFVRILHTVDIGMIFSSHRAIARFYLPVYTQGNLFEYGHCRPDTETGLPSKLPFQIPIGNYPLWAMQRFLV